MDGYLQYFLIPSALLLEVIVIFQVYINIIYIIFALLDTIQMLDMNINMRTATNMNTS